MELTLILVDLDTVGETLRGFHFVYIHWYTFWNILGIKKSKKQLLKVRKNTIDDIFFEINQQSTIYEVFFYIFWSILEIFKKIWQISSVFIQKFQILPKNDKFSLILEILSKKLDWSSRSLRNGKNYCVHLFFKSLSSVEYKLLISLKLFYIT